MSALRGHFVRAGFSGVEDLGAELGAGGAEQVGFLFDLEGLAPTKHGKGSVCA